MKSGMPFQKCHHDPCDGWVRSPQNCIFICKLTVPDTNQITMERHWSQDKFSTKNVYQHNPCTLTLYKMCGQKFHIGLLFSSVSPSTMFLIWSWRLDFLLKSVINYTFYECFCPPVDQPESFLPFITVDWWTQGRLSPYLLAQESPTEKLRG